MTGSLADAPATARHALSRVPARGFVENMTNAGDAPGDGAWTAARTSVATSTAVALLGVGTVGSAFIERLARAQAASEIRLVHVANSRHALHCTDGLQLDGLQRRLQSLATHVTVAAQPFGRSSATNVDDTLASLPRARNTIIVDATGCESVAARHAGWLARGMHVATASKLGQGGSLARWKAIADACANAGSRYGDSATVGAGLPVLPSLRALRDGGDAIFGIAGVMSGSMAWLFGAYDGLRPFSGFLRQAQQAGYTEPDPREDLSGEDVRRKLLILARAAGFALEAGQVDVDSLVPDDLAALPADAFLARADALDAPMRERFAAAYKRGERLRHIARLRVVDGVVHARVGVESLPADDPLAVGAGTDNRVAIWSERYAQQPLVIQGPGAGAGVTAAALLDDVLRITRARR